MSMNKYFYTDDKYVRLNAASAEAYIYADMFDSDDKEATKSTIAQIIGTNVQSIGIMYMRFKFTDDEDFDRDSIKPQTLVYPNMIEMTPTEISNKTKLIINDKEDTFVILKFEKDDIIMELESKHDVGNVDRFINMVLNGNIPNSLSYDDIYYAWRKNSEINGFHADVPDVIIQTIISEMCRAPGKLTDQFRKVAGKGKVDNRSYTILNMNAISAYSSVITSLGFERFSDKLTTSINLTKDGVQQKPNPLEEILIM